MWPEYGLLLATAALFGAGDDVATAQSSSATPAEFDDGDDPSKKGCESHSLTHAAALATCAAGLGDGLFLLLVVFVQSSCHGSGMGFGVEDADEGKA